MENFHNFFLIYKQAEFRVQSKNMTLMNTKYGRVEKLFFHVSVLFHIFIFKISGSDFNYRFDYFI